MPRLSEQARLKALIKNSKTSFERASKLLWAWWHLNSREEQYIDFTNQVIKEYLILTGRGWGKTLTMSLTSLLYACWYPRVKIGLIAPTHAMLRSVNFEGKAGIIAVLHNLKLYRYLVAKNNRQLKMITLKNGSTITGYSAQKPDRIRGQEFNLLAMDEFQDYYFTTEVNEVASVALRGKKDGVPNITLMTGTPKPYQKLRELAATKSRRFKLIRGTTEANLNNLAKGYLKTIKDKHKGNSRLIQQELEGKVLNEVEGALWDSSNLKQATVKADRCHYPKDMDIIVLGLDPAGGGGDRVGMVVAGAMMGEPPQYYILDDGTCPYDKGGRWIKRLADLWDKWKPSVLVVEKNFGGNLSIDALRGGWTGSTPWDYIAIEEVQARQGKMLRAQPIAWQYQEGLVKHRVARAGQFEELEEQMLTYTGSRNESSPDNLDAMVHAMTYLVKRASFGKVSVMNI